MDTRRDCGNGVKKLIKKYREEFHRAENTRHYSEENYREAEKKYIRFCLTGDPLYNDGNGRPSA